VQGGRDDLFSEFSANVQCEPAPAAEPSLDRDAALLPRMSHDPRHIRAQWILCVNTDYASGIIAASCSTTLPRLLPSAIPRPNCPGPKRRDGDEPTAATSCYYLLRKHPDGVANGRRMHPYPAITPRLAGSPAAAGHVADVQWQISHDFLL
jgi:hypothetical protein